MKKYILFFFFMLVCIVQAQNENKERLLKQERFRLNNLLRRELTPSITQEINGLTTIERVDTNKKNQIVRKYDSLFVVFKDSLLNAPPNYIEQRSKAYPPLSDQLDMIYWDKKNGTNKWIQLIDSIKAKYPKK